MEEVGVILENKLNLQNWVESFCSLFWISTWNSIFVSRPLKVMSIVDLNGSLVIKAKATIKLAEILIRNIGKLSFLYRNWTVDCWLIIRRNGNKPQV